MPTGGETSSTPSAWGETASRTTAPNVRPRMTTSRQTDHVSMYWLSNRARWAIDVSRHLAGEQRHEVRPLGPGADQRHLASHHVDQLGQLVEAGATEELADPG